VSTESVDWREQRRQKLADLAQLGLEYHPTRFEGTVPGADVKAGFERMEDQTVRVAGRIVANNRMGKAAFLRIQDSSGGIQLYIKRDVVGEELWQYHRLLDLGDIVGATGRVFKTKTEEVTVEVEQLVLLQKSYAPPPEKFHGLQDVETRYRQRYLDLIANEESRTYARKRSRMTSALRHFLDERGFMEVETPVLQPIYGGGAATPFVTRYDALDMEAYLRIADELYLKRLIVGGFERVYEIAKDFRNEGLSRKHNPEFTMLELYEAYVDYEDIMRLLEEMVAYAAEYVNAGTTVTFGEHEIRLAPPWKRVSFREAMQSFAGLELTPDISRDQLFEFARSHHVVVTEDMTRGRVLDQIWSTLVEPNLIQPTIVTDYPIDFPGSTLARASAERTDEVERFEAFMAGIEIANAFTELNDPFEQEKRFQYLSEVTGVVHENTQVDQDFITALDQGMPPTGGIGVGLDRLAMILLGVENIRETILFPFLKPREES
jgi:lysyl-tRNA synthetase class 2